MRLLTLLLITIFSFSLSAQTLDEELGFIYVKADYLMETGRYDEAIKEFTKIIAKNPLFRDAMYKRADAKYNVGAYQGTYNDLLEIFDKQGITPEGLKLFGKAQKSLGKTDAAETTLETASLLPNSNSAREKANRQSDTSTTSDNSRTTEDKVKDQAGAIRDKISSILDDLLPDDADTGTTDDTSRTTDTSSRSDDTRTTTDNGSSDRQTKNRQGGSDTSDRNNDSSNDAPVVTEPKVDDSVREIYIDEDVTLEIKNGLGARKILQQPSILLLSETSGSVVVDVCVNNNGKVTQAEFNDAESSLKTQSIISLAVRKSKEFWFKSSTESEMCGTIVFNITGS